MSELACSCPYVHSLCLILQRMHAWKIFKETCSIFKRSKPKWMHRTPYSAICTFPYSLTHFLSSHTHAHTHHHSYYCLILMSNLSLLPSFLLPSSSISPPSSRQAWERDTSVIVISMETAQQQAWCWQPIASLCSSASHPMAEAVEEGGHTRRSYGPSRWMLRKAWSGALTSWLHGEHLAFWCW